MTDTIYDLIMSGRCTPKCLCATNDNEKLCGCRCHGKYHAAATDLCLDGLKTPCSQAFWYDDDDIEYAQHIVSDDVKCFDIGYTRYPDEFSIICESTQSAVSAAHTFYRIPVGTADFVMGHDCRIMTNEFPCHDGLAEILCDLERLDVIASGWMNDQPHMHDKFVCVINGIQSYGAMRALVGILHDYITSDAAQKISVTLWHLDTELLRRKH